MLRVNSCTPCEKGKRGFVIFLCAACIFFIDFLLNVIRSGIAQDMDALTWLYYIPSAIGHGALFALIIYLIGYLPFIFIFKNKNIATGIFLFILCITQILLVINTFVYSFYKFHLNGFVLSLVIGGGSEVFEFGGALYVKFIFIALITAVLPFFIAQRISKIISSKLTRKRIVTISLTLFFCIVWSHFGHALAAATHHSGVRKSALAMPYFYPLTANTLLFRLGIVDRDNIDNLSYNITSSDIQYPLSPLVTNEAETKEYNIIYILLDSWNPTAFDPETTPHMYDFARKGQVFNNHFSSSNGTQGSIFGFFFGLPFTYEKEFSISKMSPLLLDRMIDLDYNIETFPSATFLSPPFNETIYRRVPGITTTAKGNDAYERDTYITSTFKEYIKNYDSEKPFFTFMFYDLLHAIRIPKQHQQQFQPSWDIANYMDLNNEMDRTPYFNLYRNCAYYIDSMIGEILSLLEESGYLENTVIVITGDHGQEFNENNRNYWGHGGNFSKWQVQVPFILYYPGIEEGKEFNHMTTHYDITPTMMSMFLGVENPPSDYSTGNNIYNDACRYPHPVGDHINYGFLFDDLIVTTNHFGTIEITDGQLNPMKRSALKTDDLQKALSIKTKFYK